MPRTLALVLAALALAGCLTAGPDARVEGPAPPATLPPLDLGHDHADPTLHLERAEGLTPLGSVRVAPDGYFAYRMVRAGDLLIVSLAGARAGLAVVDVADPARPALLGQYVSEYGASEGEAVEVTPDGAFAFLGIETSYSDPPVPPAIEVVSLADPAAPTLATRVPVATHPHVLGYVDQGANGFLLASDYELGTLVASGALPLGIPGAPSAGMSVYAFERPSATLRLVARHTFQGDTTGIFTHDPVTITHAATGRQNVYLAAFAGGGRILDVSEPSAPREEGHTLDAGGAPVLRHHSFTPAPALVEGALPTAAVPRSRGDDGAAFLTLYDTADPADIRLLGEWRHPDPDLVPGDLPPLNLHVPVFAANGTRLLVPHFHAGLYVFDASSLAALRAPAPIGYWMPPAGEAPAGAPTVGVVVMAVEKDGVVLATEAVTGTLHALRLDA